MARTSLSPPISPLPESITPAGKDAKFLEEFLNLNKQTVDLYRIFNFLFLHQGTFFSEREIRSHAKYVLLHGIFVDHISTIESQLKRMPKSPYRLIIRETDSHGFAYGLVTKENHAQIQHDNEISRAVTLAASQTQKAVRGTTVRPSWDVREWLNKLNIQPLSSPLRFTHTLSYVDSQVKSHCMHICLRTLAEKTGTWVSVTELEEAIDVSLREVSLPPGYSWNARFTILELVQEARSNLSVTKNNRVTFSLKENPRSFMLEVPPNFQD